MTDLVDWFSQYIDRYVEEQNGPDTDALIACLDRVRDSYRLAAQPSAGAQGEAVAWRWRIPGLLSWNVSLTADVRIQGAIVEPLYATPAQPDTGDVAALRSGDLWWNPEDWESTHMDLSEAYEDATSGSCSGVVRLSRATQLPDVWAVQIDIDTTGDGEADDYELRAYATEDEALAALSKPNAPGAG